MGRSARSHGRYYPGPHYSSFLPPGWLGYLLSYNRLEAERQAEAQAAFTAKENARTAHRNLAAEFMLPYVKRCDLRTYPHLIAFAAGKYPAIVDVLDDVNRASRVETSSAGRQSLCTLWLYLTRLRTTQRNC